MFQGILHFLNVRMIYLIDLIELSNLFDSELNIPKIHTLFFSILISLNMKYLNFSLENVLFIIQNLYYY